MDGPLAQSLGVESVDASIMQVLFVKIIDQIGIGCNDQIGYVSYLFIVIEVLELACMYYCPLYQNVYSFHSFFQI